MNRRNAVVALPVFAAWATLGSVASEAPKPERRAGSRLYAVEYRTGPRWDPARSPAEQPYFREHSAHLARLREQGHMAFGARYADKGLIVLQGDSEAEAKALVEADPSVRERLFDVEIHEFRVFYAGCVGAAKRGS